jgi:hypothetical protein
MWRQLEVEVPSKVALGIIPVYALIGADSGTGARSDLESGACRPRRAAHDMDFHGGLGCGFW